MTLCTPGRLAPTMATIGTFTKSDNGFTGTVKTLTLNVKTVKFVPTEGDSERGPDFVTPCRHQHTKLPRLAFRNRVFIRDGDDVPETTRA